MALPFRSGEMTIREAQELSKKLFGELRNTFFDMGTRRYYVGKFVTEHDRWRRDEHGRVVLDEKGKPIEASPWTRKQVLFGEGETLDEAFRFARGGRTIVGASGYTPRFDDKGRIKSIRSAAGLVVSRIPPPPSETS